MKGAWRQRDMAAVKPSVRFKSALVLPDSSLPSIMQNGSSAVAMPDSLAFAESDLLIPDGHAEAQYQSMTEKSIRRLCMELLDLKKASAEEMQRNVYANYTAFIRTSQQVSDLEAELISMKGLISTQAVLVRDLLEGVFFQSSSDFTTDVFQESSNPEADAELLSEQEKHVQILSDVFDVLLVERRTDEAFTVLIEQEKIISDAVETELPDATIASLRTSFSERKARLVEQIVESVQQPFICRNESRKLVSILKKLGEGPRAHTILLKSYHLSLQKSVENLRPACTWYTGAYTTTVSQLFFSAILRASQDSLFIFGEVPSHASELVLWACQETENYVRLVKKHILSFSAISGGLRAATDFVEISVGHCGLLEDEGLTISPFLLKLLKPAVKLVMEASIRHIEEILCVHVACDDWSFSHSSALDGKGNNHISATSGSLKLSSSAKRFNSMIQDLLEDVTPSMALHFGGLALNGIAALFEKYTDMLLSAMHDSPRNKITGLHKSTNIVMAETEGQQLVLLGNVAALADELLPRAAFKVCFAHYTKEESHKQVQERQVTGFALLSDQKEWRRQLQRAVDKLRDCFCRQHALEFIYNKDGEPLVTADFYISLFETGKDKFWQQDQMPSPAFKILFFRLNSLAQLAADALKGRERAIVLLLMRLLEAVLIWLSDNQDFWEAIEDSHESLGPIGLQQFVLDVHFTIQIASSGRYSSRKMRQIAASCISRAINAFSATGLDPNSVLPEDEWFENAAKEAIRRLLVDNTSRNLFASNEREPGSPTSVSSYSTYSVQGSP